jgi:hypothetical protein
MTLEDVGPDNWRHCAALEVEMTLLIHPVVVGQGTRHSRSTMPAEPGGRALVLAFLKASPYELRLRRARIRSMATKAMPTAITAIHRAGAPMPATSRTAPMSINATAIQMKAVMATPPLAPKRRSV